VRQPLWALGATIEVLVFVAQAAGIQRAGGGSAWRRAKAAAS